MAPRRKASGKKSAEDKIEVAVKNVSNKSKVIKKKEKAASKNSYAEYIHQLLKEMDPELGISNKAVNTIDSLVNDILDQIASEASRLAKENNKSTINTKDIQAAVKLILPGELVKHADVENDDDNENE